MSIEQTLNEINASLKALVVIGNTLTSGTTNVVADNNPRDVIFGDAEGTTYYHIAKKKQIVPVAPGGDAPAGGVRVGGVEAASLQQKYGVPKDNAPGAASTGTGAAAAATTTGAASDASGPAADDKTLTDAATKLSKMEGGRDKLKAVLTKFGVAKFPELLKLKKHAEAMAAINAEINPPAATVEPEDDDLGLG